MLLVPRLNPTGRRPTGAATGSVGIVEGNLDVVPMPTGMGAEHQDRAFEAEVAAITTAFGDPTRRSTWLFARAAGEKGVTAAEVAERLDLHPNVARHHLDKLATSTYLEVFVPRGPGAGAGRPSKRYRVAAGLAGARPGGTLEFPARRDDLMVTLLGRALALVPRDVAERMAEDVGEEYGRTLAAQMAGDNGARTFRSALHAVADALTAHGFAAHAEERDGLIAVIAEHCPFGETASQHPVICAVDRGMVRGMLVGLGIDREPTIGSSRAHGDDTCVTLV